MNSKKSEELEKARDLEGYMKRKRTEKYAWTKKNPDRVVQISKKVREKALASRQWYCETCDVALQSKTALAKHMASSSHANQLAISQGAKPQEPSTDSIRFKAFREKNRANKTHFCEVCNMAFGAKAHLKKHQASKKHLRAVEKASAPSTD